MSALKRRLAILFGVSTKVIAGCKDDLGLTPEQYLANGVPPEWVAAHFHTNVGKSFPITHRAGKSCSCIPNGNYDPAYLEELERRCQSGECGGV